MVRVPSLAFRPELRRNSRLPVSFSLRLSIHHLYEPTPPPTRPSVNKTAASRRSAGGVFLSRRRRRSSRRFMRARSASSGPCRNVDCAAMSRLTSHVFLSSEYRHQLVARENWNDTCKSMRHAQHDRLFDDDDALRGPHVILGVSPHFGPPPLSRHHQLPFWERTKLRLLHLLFKYSRAERQAKTMIQRDKKESW